MPQRSRRLRVVQCFEIIMNNFWFLSDDRIFKKRVDKYYPVNKKKVVVQKYTDVSVSNQKQKNNCVFYIDWYYGSIVQVWFQDLQRQE